jgi:hypothetical protein
VSASSLHAGTVLLSLIAAAEALTRSLGDVPSRCGKDRLGLQRAAQAVAKILGAL